MNEQAKKLLAAARKLLAADEVDAKAMAKGLLLQIMDKNISWEELMGAVNKAVEELEQTDKNHEWFKIRGKWYVKSVTPGQPKPVPATAPVKGGKGSYVIVVAEVVRGRSKGPQGFTRFKPFKYKEGGNAHGIVYANWLDGSKEAAAISRTKAVKQEMLSIMARQDPGTGNYVKSFVVVLHDVAKNKAVSWGDDDLANKGFLFDGYDSSNELLTKWKIL